MQLHRLEAAAPDDPRILMHGSTYAKARFKIWELRAEAAPLSQLTADQRMRMWNTGFKNTMRYLSAVLRGRKSDPLGNGSLGCLKVCYDKKKNYPALTTRFIHYPSHGGTDNGSHVHICQLGGTCVTYWHLYFLVICSINTRLPFSSKETINYSYTKVALRLHLTVTASFFSA